jgi:hypothetical protein
MIVMVIAGNCSAAFLPFTTAKHYAIVASKLCASGAHS